MLTLLLFIGLSASAAMGENPGAIAQAVVSGHRWESETILDTSDKASSYLTGGWRGAQSVNVLAGPGVLLGAEYTHRRGGWYDKDHLWLRAGYERRSALQTIRVIGRATVAGYMPADDAKHEVALELDYRCYAKHLTFRTQQGLLAFQQAGWKLGYYTTISVGVRFGLAGQQPGR
jgi:hypothetical protein